MDVEVCTHCADADTTRLAVEAAFAGGAARVELCSAMHLDGLTPPAEHVAVARTAFQGRPGLMVMVRPRAGDFCFSRAEVDQMARQIEMAQQAGADGVVLGVLRAEDGSVDRRAMERLLTIAHAAGLKSTFHRAFDATPDPDAALETLVDLGVDRLLTSGVPWGQKGTALDGVERLAQTIRQSRGRIEVVLAGGISPANVGMLLGRLPTDEGIVSVHAYSGAQIGGRTRKEAIQELVEACHKYHVDRQQPGQPTLIS